MNTVPWRHSTSIWLVFAAFLVTLAFGTPLFAQSDTTYLRALSKQIKDKRYWASVPDSIRILASHGLHVAETINDESGKADMNKFLGIYYWTIADHANAIRHYHTGRLIYESLGKTFEAAQMLSNLGMVYSRLGDNEKSLACYQSALQTMEAMPQRDITSMAATMSSMGLLFRNHNDLGSASFMFKRSLSLYEKAGDSLNIAGTLTNIATVYNRKQIYDSALYFNEKALHIFQKLSNPKGLVIAYNNLAAVALSQEKFDKADAYLARAYAINMERNFIDSQISTLIGRGQVKLGKQLYEEAEKHFVEAELLAKSKSRARLIEVYKGLSDANRGMRDLQRSLEWYDKYVHLKDSIYSQENASTLSNLRISHELDRKNSEIVLLEKDNKIEKLSRNIAWLVTISICLLVGVLSYFVIQKIRRDKMYILQQAQSHEAEQAIAQTELESRKRKEEELNRELEFRNRALTTYTLNLVQKNGMLNEVREIVQDVLKVSDKKDADLKKLIRLIDYSFTLDKDWDGFKTYFEQVHPEFFKNLKTTFPELSATELRLCALIRLSLSIKESATILSISPDSVKVSRSRLRKKLRLTTDDNLTDFIMAV